MIICTVIFDKNKDEDAFSRLIKVWEYTARLYNPNATIKIVRVPAPEPKQRKCDQFLTYTSSYAVIKMAEWVIEQDDNIIMTDADVMFTGNCESVFNEKYDIGVTVRFARGWINAGVMFYQPSGKERLQEMIDLTKNIVDNPELYIEHINKYLGGDQTALTLLTMKYNFKRFLCSEWNLEQNSWDYFSRNTKIVHIKSNLFDLVNGVKPRINVPSWHNSYYIYERWLNYYFEAVKNDKGP